MFIKCNIMIQKFNYFVVFSSQEAMGKWVSDQIINFDNYYIIKNEIKSRHILLRMNQLFRDGDRRCRFSLSSLACGQYLPGWSGLTFKQDLTNFQIV